MYAGDDLTNFWGLVATGVAFGLTAMTLSDRRWKYGLFAGGAIFTAAGFCWGVIKAAVPAAGPAITQITAQPTNWFLLFLMMAVALWLHQWRKEVRVELQAKSTAVVHSSTNDADIAALKAITAKMQAELEGSSKQSPKHEKPAFNWVPWKMRARYTLDEFSKILVGINPGGGATHESNAYLDVLLEQVSSGAILSAGGYRLTRVFSSSEINRADALKWAKRKNIPVPHIDD